MLFYAVGKVVWTTICLYLCSCIFSLMMFFIIGVQVQLILTVYYFCWILFELVGSGKCLFITYKAFVTNCETTFLNDEMNHYYFEPLFSLSFYWYWHFLSFFWYFNLSLHCLGYKTNQKLLKSQLLTNKKIFKCQEALSKVGYNQD